ncbi:hypothetical protein [Bacillus sp. JCM 19041]|uniref:hypothetical protein n=1 Tax=Bacillus sp. JCM 19041 TaxID=1460637 RepID=UPI0006CF5049
MIIEDTGAVSLMHQFKEPVTFKGKQIQLEMQLTQMYMLQASMTQSLKSTLNSGKGDFIETVGEEVGKHGAEMRAKLEMVSEETKQVINSVESYFKTASEQRVTLHYRVVPID